jgi:hypothetical protein
MNTTLLLSVINWLHLDRNCIVRSLKLFLIFLLCLIQINLNTPYILNSNDYDIMKICVIGISEMCSERNKLLKSNAKLFFYFKYFIDKSIGLDNRLCLYKSSPTTRWNNLNTIYIRHRSIYPSCIHVIHLNYQAYTHVY